MITSMKNLGHGLSAATESVLYVRNAKIAKVRVMATAALFGTVFLVSTSHLAMATDLKTYTNKVGTNTSVIPDIVGYICYLGGAVLAALGIVDLKKHVENPSQTPMKNGLAKLGFGGALLALPAIVDVMQGTTGVTGEAPSFDKFGAQGPNV